MTKTHVDLSRVDLITISQLIATKLWKLSQDIKRVDEAGQDPQMLRDAFAAYRELQFTIDDAKYQMEVRDAQK